MQKEKRALVILFLFVLISSLTVSAAGADFSVMLKPIRDQISLVEEARFNLMITNHQDAADDFRIYYSDIEWDVSTDPLTDSTLNIKPGETGSTMLTLRPLKATRGVYGIPISIRSVNTDEVVYPKAFVEVRPEGYVAGRYIPSLSVDIQFPKDVDPRKPFSAKVNIRNRNPLNISSLTIRIESPAFLAEKTVPLEPLGKAVATFTITLDPMESPGRQTAAIRLLVGEDVIYDGEKVFEILDYSELVQQWGEVGKSFLRTEKTLRVENVGNAEKFQEVRVMDTAFLGFIATRSSPEARRVREDGKAYLIWKVVMGPGETREFSVVTDYRPAAATILVMFIIIMLYYMLRSPIVVRKQVSDVVTKEGGIHSMKVLLDIRNRSRSMVADLTIIDRVPNLAEINRDFELGTLKPAKILKHERKGSLVKWEIREMHGFEERILLYTVRSKLTILGEFHLPGAFVKFRDSRGRERVRRSNRLVVS